MRIQILPWIALSVVCMGASAARSAEPPKPYGATPTAVQVRHAAREFYAFCHFTVNTFTDREWGNGAEDPETFNPTAFDADQMVRAVKAAGAKGLILTAKHHDGFCLWPTRTTEHSIRHSPYKDGKGDIVREFCDACRRQGIEFGIYVSPWDRNNEFYGTPKYSEEVYKEQIRELVTGYGKLFEIWFDGANGGTGYYGGKGGGRRIDRATYYNWPDKWKMVTDLQPDIIIFSDIGPGLRWVGNESGRAPDPCRATIDFLPTEAPGRSHLRKLGTGVLHGKTWCQAEVDVSIRGGWFFHPGQQPREPKGLMNIYMNSVGRGATLNLNVPPDHRGQFHENDVESLRQFGEHLRQTFATNLAAGAKLVASNTRGPEFGPEKLLDADLWSAWISDDAVTTPEVTLELAGEKTFNLIRLREDIRLGLRLEGVAVDAWQDGAWKEIARAESIGSCHLWRVPKTTTGKVRIRVTQSPVCPALSDFGLFLEPEFGLWVPPIGGDPVAAMKSQWKVVEVSYEAPGGEARQAIDADPRTLWHTYGPDSEHHLPQYIVVDLGADKTLKGFTYTPRTESTSHGVVDQYSFFVSTDARQWTLAAEGEFGNLRANRIEQTVSFAPVKARYFKFVARHALERNHAVVAELGVVE